MEQWKMRFQKEHVRIWDKSDSENDLKNENFVSSCVLVKNFNFTFQNGSKLNFHFVTSWQLATWNKYCSGKWNMIVWIKLCFTFQFLVSILILRFKWTKQKLKCCVSSKTRQKLKCYVWSETWQKLKCFSFKINWFFLKAFRFLTCSSFLI